MSRTVLSAAAFTALLVASLVAPAIPVTPTGAADAPESVACGLGTSVTDESNASISITTWVAPAGAADELRNASAVTAAIDAGTMRPASGEDGRAVTNGDLVVHRIRLNGSASRLLDRLAAENRGSSTENFRALVREEGVRFRYVGPTACPPRIVLNATIERGALRIVPDRRNETLYLLVDVDDVVFDRPTGDENAADAWDWGRHAVSLSLRTTGGLVTENVTAEADYDVRPREVTFEAPTPGLLRASGGSNLTIRGHTNAVAGTQLRVTLRPVAAATDPLTATAIANGSGNFSVPVNLSAAGESALYAVTVAGPDRDETATPLVAVGNATGAVVRASQSGSDGRSLYGVAVTTTDGGFVVVENASGAVVGRSEYLSPGTALPDVDLHPPMTTDGNLTVTAYRDVDDDRTFDAEDEPYRVNGSVVRDTASVVIEGEPPTDTTRTTRPPSSEQSTATTDGVRRSTSVTETTRPTAATETIHRHTSTTPKDVSLPGFDGVSVIVAVLVSASLVRRHAR